MTRLFAIALFATMPSLASAFERVTSRDDFVSLVAERDLTRFGIRLAVSPEGGIAGRAFGKDVRGQWRWADGYFCRDLWFGSQDLGPNCQTVEVRGATMRFTADRGTGQSADLRLD